MPCDIRIFSISDLNVTLRAIWYHLYNLKNLKSTHGGVSHLVKLQASPCNLTKSNTPPWVVFFTFFKLYRWYQIAIISQIWNHLAMEVHKYRNNYLVSLESFSSKTKITIDWDIDLHRNLIATCVAIIPKYKMFRNTKLLVLREKINLVSQTKKLLIANWFPELI